MIFPNFSFVADALARLAEDWSAWIVATSWQVSLLIVFVALLDRLLGRTRRPQLRYGLWMLVAIKLVLPPGLPSPLAIAAQSIGWISPTEVAISPAQAAVSATDSAASGLSPLDPRLVLFTVWLIGSIVVVRRTVRRSADLRRSVVRESRPAPPAIVEAARAVADRIGLDRCPEILLTSTTAGEEFQSPFVLPRSLLPLVKPGTRVRVVLPERAVRRWSTNELEHVLAHELAHIARRDLWAESFFAVVHALFWFHPLVYFARGRAHQLRELCCDAAVARHFGDDYRKTLVRAAADSLLGAPGPLAAAFRGQSGRSGQMIERLQALEAHDRRTTHPRRSVLTAALLLLAAAVLPMARPTIALTSETSASGLDGASGQVLAADDLAEARRMAEIAIADGEGIGSLHMRYAIQRLNVLESNQVTDRPESVNQEQAAESPHLPLLDGQH